MLARDQAGITGVNTALEFLVCHNGCFAPAPPVGWEEMTDTVKATLAHWPEVSQSVFVPHTERDFGRLVALLAQLVNEVGNDESHPLTSLMEVVGLLIEKYEEEQVPELEESSIVREDPPPRPM
jgi:HTH-type transcriptional regulator / antitoxin HigA